MAIEKQINIVVKETGLDEVNKKVDKLDNSLSDLEKQQRSLAGSMGESSQSVLDNGGAMGLLNDATGGLAMTVKDAVEASWLFTKSQKAAAIQQAIATTVVGTSTGAMKAFRIALAATGIGLLVIGLGLLVANFDKVKKAVLAFIPGLATVGEFVGNLVESFTDFIGVTSEAERNMARLTEQAKKSNAMNEKFLAEEGDRVNEYTKQKIEARKRYNDAVQEDGANQVKLAARLNRELIAIEQKHNDDLAKKRKDKQDKINEENERQAEKDKADAEKRKAERLKQIEKEKTEAQDFNDFRKSIIDADIENTIQSKNDKVSILQEGLKVINDNEEKGYDESKKISDKKIKDEELVKEAKVQIANSVFDLVNMFAKKGSKLAKGVAAAQATMNTFQGVTAALSAPSTIPEPFGTALKIANSVAIGTMGFMNVKKILSTNEQGGGSAPSTGGAAAPQAPSFNLVQGTGQNQIAQSISSQAPVKAYVVSKDMTTGQEMDRNIVKSASI